MAKTKKNKDLKKRVFFLFLHKVYGGTMPAWGTLYKGLVTQKLLYFVFSKLKTFSSFWSILKIFLSEK